MDSHRLLLSRENPRTLAFSTERVVSSANVKSMPNEIGQKPPPSVLERFKALLKERDDDVPPPNTEEIVQLYELLLSELTFNSKPIITDLTIIAGEQRVHGKGIADAICNRILEVSAEQKLPSLYLLDSIVKNIGRDYVRHFSSRLPEVFCEAFRQVQPNLHNSMRHLFGTWSTVFPDFVLRKIEAQLQFSKVANGQLSNANPLRVSESSRTHGIHVNPKYLRQLESSSVDSVAGERFDSTGSAVQTSYGLGANKMHPSVTSRLGKASSPLSVSIDEYAVENSTGRAVDRVSPSHPAFDYGLGKKIGRDEELSEWQRKPYSGVGRSQFQISKTYSFSNGLQRQSPRALIDAYGSEKGTEASSNEPLLVERLNVNSIDKKVVSTSWKNSEEEEFDWEDMSPTLVDHNRSNGFLPSAVLSRERPGFVTANAASLDQDTRSSWTSRSQLPLFEDSSVIVDDVIASSGYGRGSLGQVSGFQAQKNQNLGSRHPHDGWSILHQSSLQHPFNGRGRGRNVHMSPNDNIPNADIRPYGIRPSVSRMGSSGLESNVEARPSVLPSPFGMRPPMNVHTTRPPNINPTFPFQKHIRSQFETINANNTILNQGPNKSLLVPEQQLDALENKDPSKSKLSQLPNPLAGLISLNQQNRGQVTTSPRHGAVTSTAVSNTLPVVQFPLPVSNIANNSFHLQGARLPPLPPNLPTAPSQAITHPNPNPFVSSQQPTGAFSGLIDSLMAQGLISLTKQSPVQDSVGIEFNPDVLKVRHESAISALYTDLPRQCTTCGLRFKCQEEHSNHMDWHVTKNRMSRSRKQKPSRKWFVSQSMWLSGAEALGAEGVPGFLPTETMEEKKDDEEVAVPADEDQTTCALCGEPFDEFYSDETEEWMYKGAVYLNAPKGATAGMDRSQLGPIVHAKCRSESSMVPPEDFGQDERGTNEEGSQRKRMRS
ncbi:hypothetical protein L6164_035864 [Bauhinia variegata]|uniref:Uncharacterized protein n=1 Tax=Bauhinia variegata TaxID=167791 RepID=A0ACB9KFI6_BAUVA|nr:hypothetical protein L6164_035864 [Bauhinia variegata]